MTDRKLYTIDEAKNLSITDIHRLYKDFVNPNQTDIFSLLPSLLMLYNLDLFCSLLRNLHASVKYSNR